MQIYESFLIKPTQISRYDFWNGWIESFQLIFLRASSPVDRY